MPACPSRRTWLMHTVPGLLAAAATPRVLADGDLLDEQSTEAKALGYRHDAAKVDAAAWPKWQAGRTCANCQLYVGKPADKQGGCTLFYGPEVAAAGWCDLWEKR